MRLTVIGTGYLGLTHAVCMADLGHQIVAIDVDKRKIAMASRGELPFFEPGPEPLLRKIWTQAGSGSPRLAPKLHDSVKSIFSA
jgi:UDP-glucose 6-dehydrogenase